MGKRKINTERFIQNKNQRNVTFSKRKRGILKKAIELSSLCGLDIFMVIFDKEKQKMIEFRSRDDFTSKIVAQLTQKDISLQFKHEVFTNEDYNRFSRKNEDEREESDFESKNEVCHPENLPYNLRNSRKVVKTSN